MLSNEILDEIGRTDNPLHRLRIRLFDAGLMEYNDTDELFVTLCRARDLLRERIETAQRTAELESRRALLITELTSVESELYHRAQDSGSEDTRRYPVE